jgi:hypothetical protein
MEKLKKENKEFLEDNSYRIKKYIMSLPVTSEEDGVEFRTLVTDTGTLICQVNKDTKDLTIFTSSGKKIILLSPQLDLFLEKPDIIYNELLAKNLLTFLKKKWWNLP